MKVLLKTPITYYGGKQRLAIKILELIPEHVLYCEPFIGGGAVFFAKQASTVEVLNDTNGELMNFYRMVQVEFTALQTEISSTLHSRDSFRRASVIYNNPDMFSEIKRAWAIWVLCNQSFGAKLNSTWGYDVTQQKSSKCIAANRERFTEQMAIRLQHVQLECSDALQIISRRDREASFFYLDPPYFNANCGHYNGYSVQDFENLLELLSGIKGKFLLSAYPSALLSVYVQRMNWFTWSVKTAIVINNKGGDRKEKTEVLIANYPIQ